MQKWYEKATVQGNFVKGFFGILIAIIAGIFALYQHKNDDIKIIKHEIPLQATDTLMQEDDSSGYNYSYSERQIRVEIMECLREGNIDKAIKLFENLTTIKAKEEEYKHLFNYCIKNKKIKKAEFIVESYFPNDKKDAARKRIASERLKIDN